MLNIATLFGTHNSVFDGKVYPFSLLGQRIWVLASTVSQEAKALEEVDFFLRSYFRPLDRFETVELEKLSDEIRHISLDLSVTIVVLEENIVSWAVCNGFVWMKRGNKQGFLSRSGGPKIVSQGPLMPQDIMVFFLGQEFPNLIKERAGSVSFQAEDSFEGRGLALVVEGKVADKKPSFWRTILARRKSKQVNIYIKNDERKKYGKIVFVLFLVLMISVGLGWRKRQSQMKLQAFEEIYQPTLTLLIEAEQLYPTQPLISREKLVTARSTLAQNQSLYEEGTNEIEKLQTLGTKIEELYARVSGERKIENPPLFFDLHLVREDMMGTKMAYGDGNIVVLDVQKGILVSVDFKTKNSRVLAGGEILQDSEYLAASTGKAVVLAQKGLVGAYFGDRSPEVLVDRDEAWQEPVSLAMFGGNVYLTDGETGDVWLYPGVDGALGERKRWLGPGVVPDFSGVTSMTVDGDLWVGYQDGSLERYRRGAPLSVRLSGLSQPLGDVRSIGAIYEGEDLYVFDKTLARIVIFGKDGVYKKQYLWEGLSRADDMVLVEETDASPTLLVLSQSTIYQIPLE